MRGLYRLMSNCTQAARWVVLLQRTCCTLHIKKHWYIENESIRICIVFVFAPKVARNCVYLIFICTKFVSKLYLLVQYINQCVVGKLHKLVLSRDGWIILWVQEKKLIQRWKYFTDIPGQANERTLLANRIIWAILRLLFDATTHQSFCFYTITNTRRAEGDRRAVAAASHAV